MVVLKTRNLQCCLTLFSFSFFYTFILFIFGCVGSSLLCAGFLQLRRAGATLHCGARASHCGGFSLQSTGSRRVGSRSCGSWAQQLWSAGLVAPWHVGSSRTRARTCVSCIGRRILNHCTTTREVPVLFFKVGGLYMCFFLLIFHCQFIFITSNELKPKTTF